MLGIGVLAAIPGFLVGFKVKPFIATLISLFGQGFFAFSFVMQSMNKPGWVSALAGGLLMLYVILFIFVVLGRIARRPMPWKLMQWALLLAGFGFIYLLMLAGPQTSLVWVWLMLSWVFVLPPFLHALVAKSAAQAEAPSVIPIPAPNPANSGAVD